MKKRFTSSQIISMLIILGIGMPSANAQILKKLQKKAERTVERKLEQKTERETNKAMDSILDPNEKSTGKENPNNQSTPSGSSSSKNKNNSEEVPKSSNVSDNLQVYSKYDFVPGDKVMFFDDFSQDFVGDFPSKWNTNASGEVVKINNVEGNWFEFKPGYGIYYIPDVNSHPEDYSIEFDIVTQGVDKNTSSVARMNLTLRSEERRVGKS